ncbi:putative aldehyde dehydrogenase [Caenibius tardaugens NBRC 16725]|uniref:Putative aldehyde dehydrogenase n=1 Tax=Caenibius tardaugens NBRC 16725 TaxID=1219035 RepID=U2YHU6_9SPHN|nr:aldehyde dehydrogenase family protein [Caenibius tardaugens]AZI37217.1 aldehyde dehydrogenase family protein [Caenibius tardaugens NBRC 16725]GAD47537.1 putative aldehyde dehydrogenase [Caenibius tardaugens NBRC 16725]
MQNSADQRALLGEAARRFVTKPLRMMINGQWCDASSGERRDVIDPATGLVVTSVPAGGKADIDRAVTAARSAFEGAWRGVGPSMRERLLLKLADLVEQHADELAELETIDNGKLLSFSRHGDLQLAMDSLRYNAGWATKIEGRTIDPSFAYVPGMRFSAQTLREPVGVVGQIIPWNFPLVMAVWKIAPALAAGCTVVLKPAEDTPLTALRLGELICEAGFPDGVVNIVTGDGTAGAALVDHLDIDKIAFTGSTEVGQAIQRKAADTMKRISLELGGKSPVVILKDADVGQAIQGAAQAVFFNHGQVCTAGSRLFVERPIYDAVVEGLGQVASSFKLGSGFSPDSMMGPLVSHRHRERVLSFIEKGRDEGGELIAGGQCVNEQGWFLQPAVFANTQPSATIFREEIFGPVLSVTPFDGDEAGLSLANDTRFGLGASVFSNDLARVQRFTRGFRAGIVWVNAHNLLDPAVPFGGVRMSGFGKELGHSALDLYTEEKSIIMPI